MKAVIVLLFLATSTLALPTLRRQKRQVDEAVLTFCREQLDAHPFQMFFADPADCSKYYQCFQQGSHLLAANIQCSAGQVWYQTSLTCIRGTCEDRCADPEVSKEGFYASESNCGEFFQCNFGISVQKCCPSGLGWNQTAHHCDNTPCDQVCTPTPQVQQTGEEVELEEGQCHNGNYIYWAGDSPDAYKMLPVVREPEEEPADGMCPSAAPIFDVGQCGCVGHDIQIFSESGNCMMFDYQDAITPGRPAWVDNFGTVITDGEMCFDGQSFMQVPYYSALDWSLSFTVQFKFNVDGDLPSATQSFISNGGPLVIQLNGGQIEAVLTGVNGDACTVSVAAAAPGGDVKMTYDGKVGGAGLTLKVGEEEAKVACSGAVKISPNPVSFGTDFVGCMDEIKICTHV